CVDCRVPGFSLGLRQTKLIWPILLLLFVGAILTALLPSPEDRGPLGVAAAVRRAFPPQEVVAREHGSDGTKEEERFTIIIQTYNRTDILLKVLNHYQAVPHLHQIIIVWNNVGEQTPLTLWNTLGPHPVPVVFKEQASNLMRNRLQPFPEIVTDAVLMLDDDILLSVPDISFAFSVWKQFSEQIVGFVPRKHVLTSRGVYSYGSFELQDPQTAGGDRLTKIYGFMPLRFSNLMVSQFGFPTYANHM
ncbi:unnamed protein product, partial [Tetraodon nigroviridis]